MQNARAWWTAGGVVLLLVCMSLLVAAFGVQFAASAVQTVPHRVHFQGKLVDAAGSPRPDGLYVMKFGFYSSPTGGTWYGDETCQQANRVQVRNGIFSVQLGSCTPVVSPNLFSQYPVYVEVQLPTPATATCATAGCANWSEPAMTPRLQVGSSPYALNSDTLDGLDADAFAQVAANNTFTGTTTFRSNTNSTGAFAIQNSSGASLLVADTTNMQLKVGGGDVLPNATPTLLVVDHKSAAGDPAGVNGAMYYNAAAKKFRCYQDSVWKDCIGGDFGLRDGYLYQTDFVRGTYPASNAAYDETLTMVYNAPVTAVVGTSTPGYPGVVRFSAASAGAGGAAIKTPVDSTATPSVVRFGAAAWSYVSNVRISGAASGYVFRSGFLDRFDATEPDGGVVNGCYTRYSSPVGTWNGVCRANGVESTCDTGLPLGSGWHNVGVAVNSAGTLATFTVDDVHQCTIASNIPTAADVTGFGAQLSRAAGTAAGQMTDIDYMEVRSLYAR